MRTMIAITTLIAGFGLAVPAGAGDRAANGLLLGAGSGALIGQAIGRNTGATLLGTAVGGVLGYIIGNESEKGYGPRPAYAYRYEEPVYYQGVVASRDCGQCREAEILGTVNGEARTIVATVCRDHYGRWLVRDDLPFAVRTRTVVVREPARRCSREPLALFNIGLGWNGGHDDHRWGGGPRWRHEDRGSHGHRWWDDDREHDRGRRH